jgi:hypothetical protein
MMQRIKDALGNIADVINKVGHDGKEHVIIKKPYKDFYEQEEELAREDTERERRTRESIASKCITDWRDLFDDKGKQES